MSDSTGSNHPAHLWEGFWGIHLLHVGQRVGLFQALREPMTASALASKLHLETRYTELWCTAAVACGLLECESERFRCPERLRDWLQLSQGFTESHLHLSSRLQETFQAVLSGRALPEPPVALRLILSESLLRNYLWVFEQVPAESPEFAAALRRSTRALEIGCGLGLGLGVLRSHFSHLELYGLEADFECAREAERSSRAVVHVGDLPGDRFGKNFDLIVCFRALASAAQPEELLYDCARLLTPNGWLVLGTELQDQERSRKSSARSLGELFAYQMLMGQAQVNFFNSTELRAMLERADLEIQAEIDAPDWGTPLYLCTRKSKS